MKEQNKIIDLSTLSDKELLNEFADRFLEYDYLRDDEIEFLDEHPVRDFWDDEQEKEYRDLLIDIDNSFCRVRECVQFIKKNDEILT